jgi:hypothetical protein
VVAGVALFLFAVPGARADQLQPRPDPRVVHLQFCLFELREAKEDVRRELKGTPAKELVEILDGLDAALEQAKKTITNIGGEPAFIEPARQPATNFRHLRHALMLSKLAREQLKIQEGIGDETRAVGIKEIDRVVQQIDTSLTRVLLLSANARPQPEGDQRRGRHLVVALFELREAKEDVRMVKGLSGEERLEILGSIDSALEQLKKTIGALNIQPDPLPPPMVPELPNVKYLRRAITATKTARDELKVQDGVPEEVRAAALKEMEKCLPKLEKALEYAR